MKKITIIFLLAAIVFSLCACDSSDYKKAMQEMDIGNFVNAAQMFEALGEYKDSASLTLECRYKSATELLDTGKYDEAITEFSSLGEYKDSASLILECNYMNATRLLNSGKYDEAIEEFSSLGEYKDCAGMIEKAEGLKLEKIITDNPEWICEYDDSAHIKEILSGDIFKYAVEDYDFTQNMIELSLKFGDEKSAIIKINGDYDNCWNFAFKYKDGEYFRTVMYDFYTCLNNFNNWEVIYKIADKSDDPRWTRDAYLGGYNYGKWGKSEEEIAQMADAATEEDHGGSIQAVFVDSYLSGEHKIFFDKEFSFYNTGYTFKISKNSVFAECTMEYDPDTDTIILTSTDESLINIFPLVFHKA